MRIDNRLGLASVQHSTVSSEPVPPNAGHWEIFAADNADGADGRIGKNIYEIGDEIFIDDESILMEINFKFGVGRSHSGLIAGGHRRGVADGDQLDGKAVGNN